MNQITLKEKVFNLQSELEFVKQVLEKEPDFNIDERNWKGIRAAVKNTRKRLYQIRYGKGKGLLG